MGERPYTVLSCCVSLDGYLDNGDEHRLLLSSEADLDRVDAVRASCDAILVGAATVRNDNPRLLVRAQGRRDQRTAHGQPPSPIKVTVTESGDLDPGANFFAVGYGEKLVYCASAATDTTRERLGSTATVIDGGEAIDMCWVSEDLHRRGVRRLMVEGGGKVHTQFLTADLADELHLAMAPFFVGDSRARRFVGDGRYPWGPDRRATLADTQRFDDVVLLRYSLSPRFRLD